MEDTKRNRGASLEEDRSLAVRAAWMHYVGGMTQAEVAKYFQLSSVKVHRLIARASRDGLVQIFVDGEVAECVALEQRLMKRYRLRACHIVPAMETDRAYRALGNMGAQFLRRLLMLDGKRLIGIGHGRTLASCVAQLPRMKVASGVRFLSLLGGLTRRFAANPHDVIHRLAERTGAYSFVMPVPFLADSEADRKVFLSQAGMRAVIDYVRRVDWMIGGIGTVENEASLAASGMLDGEDMACIKRTGAVGELLGHFFNAFGKRVPTPLDGRVVGPDFETVARCPNVVAIAGGDLKVAAIQAVLASGVLGVLLSDESTAKKILEQGDE